MKVYVSNKILKQEGNYIDQLSPEGTLVPFRGIENYLRSRYGISQREYYNLIFFGEKEHHEYCKYCGKEVGFISISKGYHQFCNGSCVTKFRLEKESKEGRNPFQKKEFIEINRKRISEFQKSRVASGEHHLLTEESQRKASEKRYLAYGFETTNLYICDVDLEGFKKIGVSINPRNRHEYKHNKIKLRNHEILFTSTPEEVTNLEKLIKEKFCDNSELIRESDVDKLREFITTSTTIVSSPKQGET